LRKAGSSWNEVLKEAHETHASLGDVVISVGLGSKVEIEFSDGAKSYLNNSGLLRIRPGTKDLLLTQGEEIESGTFKTEKKGGENLLYVGNFPLRFLTPIMGEPLIIEEFPQEVRVSFELVGLSMRQDSYESMKRWKLIRVSGKDQAIQEVAFIPLLERPTVFVANLKISEIGDYKLLPESTTVGATEGFLILVKGRDSLDAEVQKLLMNSESNPSGGIELRAK
jgi:hypothetical protein